MILLIDNYDSFVFNLARYIERLGQQTWVVRNDKTDVAQVQAIGPDAIVLSPGPCTPAEAGISLDLVKAMHNSTPILGVCLGHQTIAAALGGKIVKAQIPMHGRTSQVTHDGKDLFASLPKPMTVGRYHSLIVEEDSLPKCFEISARSEQQEIMGLRHRALPVVGVQFHPESILTDHGYPLLANFLRLAGLSSTEPQPTIAEERNEKQRELTQPSTPVTF